jgi:pyridoxamine 5'-phosphate oxidase family protein
MTSLSPAERGYLRSQLLGRMATVERHGQPQVNPVAYRLQDDDTILVRGLEICASKKWRNLRTRRGGRSRFPAPGR